MENCTNSEHVGKPFSITVTADGRENLVLRTLVRQAIPILKQPEAFPAADRLHLAQMLTSAVGGIPGVDEEEVGDVLPEEELHFFLKGAQG